MKTSEILNKAASIQETYGHCKGELRTDEGRVCLQGAIYEATGARWSKNEGGIWFAEASQKEEDAFNRANRAVQAVLQTYGSPWVPTYIWNDSDDVTKDEVVKLLREAAAASDAARRIRTEPRPSEWEI